MTPRTLRMSPSWASFSHSQSSSANSVPSEGEESLSRDTTSIAPSWPSLSGSSSRSRRMTESSSQGKCQTQKADSINHMPISTRTPARHAKPKTIWSTHDSFLPRAKPPPPLKHIKHRRDRSECNKPPPDPTTSSHPSTSSNKSSPQLPQLHSTASPSFPSSLDAPILGGHRDGPVIQHGLTWPGNRLTIASESSDETGVSLAPSKSGSGWKWKPPTSWAGPPKAASADEDDRPKPVGGWRFSKKKCVESSSQDSSSQAPTGLNRARSLNELKPVQFRPDEHVIGSRCGPLSPGVKIQCYENQEWQEKPVADVIPMLRELRIK